MHVGINVLFYKRHAAAPDPAACALVSQGMKHTHTQL
jgi:hypothetical protein